MSIKQTFMNSAEGRDSLNSAARLMGQKGGPAAAKVRFSKMTADQRSEHGRNLVAARWEKRRKLESQLESTTG